MIENLLAGFSLFMAPTSLLALAVGVVIGMVIGAIPGMSTVMAVSIVLPFTFGLDPTASILLLLGIYKGGMFGGSISAILINTPGTPAASCTMLDGYPMSQKGQARPALEMALFASCFGDMISNFVLIAFAAWLASFALDFGPPELFALVVFALTIVAGVAADQIAKGFIAMAVGLLMATVGLDLIAGTHRFTFGHVDLSAGLSLVPVLIGLFAIPEVLENFSSKDKSDEVTPDVTGTKLGARRFFSHWRTLFRGSFIGVILGVVPGLGPTPAAFFSYGSARRKSPEPESFGKGNIDGVAAAESANSAVGGSSMVPLLALGIPGDVVTAVILGAFMIHGLQPGPLMFESNMDLIYAIFMGLIAGSIILFVLGKASVGVLSKILNLRPSILLPTVLVLCVYGSYAVNKNMFDVLVMFMVGVFGYLMVKLNFPRAPLLIGFVLGPLLEDNFRQSLLIGQGEISFFFSSKISILFWGFTAVYLLSQFGGSLIKWFKNQKIEHAT
ncbi:MAG TPA: tripartite tricarboxylate transporter permease [Paenalcaligenes sp.]|nr:tripartite tricarboxylate transporter permease [Paenalcaligenes sp.]